MGLIAAYLMEQDGVVVPFTVTNPLNGSQASGKVLIDPGAQKAVISPSIITAISATPDGSIDIIGVGSGPILDSEYSLDIDLGAYGKVNNVQFVSSDLTSFGVDMLLGRNILRYGSFYYDGQNGYFELGIDGVGASGSMINWEKIALVGAAILGVGAIGFAIYDDVRINRMKKRLG